MLKGGITLLMFSGSTSLVSSYVRNLKPILILQLQANLIVLFHRKNRVVFQSGSLQGLEVSGLPGTVFPVITVPWSSGILAFLFTRAR